MSWYHAYALSYRDVDELMAECTFSVEHSTINLWIVHYSPQLEKEFRDKKKLVGNHWRLDENYIKVKGTWKYFYRAVDHSTDAWLPNFHCAQKTLAGIEQVHMNKKGQQRYSKGGDKSPAELFYSLAA